MFLIGNGRLIPAKLLKKYIEILIHNLDIQFYNTSEIYQKIDKNIIKGKNILLVDEIHDTRSTMNYGIKYLKDSNINKLTIIELYNKDKKCEIQN